MKQKNPRRIALDGGARAFFPLLQVILICSFSALTQIHAESVLKMAESRYLFLDMAETEGMEGLVQAVNPAEKPANNPVLTGTPGAWDEARAKLYGTVIHEPGAGLWKMWYSGTQDVVGGEGGMKLTDSRHLGYAVSRDGLHWEKPKLAIVDYLGSKENNLVLLDGQAPNIIDLKEKAVPGAKRRYRMYVRSFWGPPPDATNFRWLGSDDGLHWEEEGRLSRQQMPLDLSTLLYDPDDPNPERRWKAYGQLYDYPLRKLGVATSSDGVNWTKPILIMHPADGLEDEDHFLGVTKYQGYYIAHYDFMYRGHNCATELAVSRDGIHFARILNGHKVIPLGKKGDFDSSMITVSTGFLTLSGKHYLYYSGADKNYQEGPRNGLGEPWRRHTGLAMWRQDGFTDLRVAQGRESGWFVTKAIQAVDAGRYELWVNVNAPGPNNALKIQLLDGESDQPLPSYQRPDRLSGANSLDHVITWKGSADLSGIRVRSIRIRFTLEGQDIHLYSFGFRKKGAHRE